MGCIQIFRGSLTASYLAARKQQKPPREVAFDRTLVAPFGFEPKTDYLEGSCSIQLSYGVENGAIKCRGGRIRTYDLLVPNQARYRATLHPEKKIMLSLKNDLSVGAPTSCFRNPTL